MITARRSQSDAMAIPGAFGSAVERDYRQYRLSRPEYWFSLLIAAPVLAFVGYVFYGGWIAPCCLALSAFAYPRYRARRMQAQRETELKEQFKQFLFIISAALASGKSFDNALRSAYLELDAAIVGSVRPYFKEELAVMLDRIRNGASAPAVFEQFAERSGIEDIRHFADVLMIVTRSGGNLIEIIRRAIFLMTDKLELEREIELAIAQKKWEAHALSVLPIAMIAMLKLSSPDYMAPLYNGAGRLLMSAALLLLIGSMWMVRRMMDIRA